MSQEEEISEALSKARLLHNLLLQQNMPVQHLYLFGSAAQGTTHRWSDIDVAIVCTPFDDSPLQEYRTIAKHAYAIDPRISLLYFRPEHFYASVSSVVREVQKKGISVEG